MVAESLHWPLFLTGLMGSGKSTVGALLAEALRREFVDIDRLVEAQLHKPIHEIFSLGGEPEFRAAERESLAALCRADPVVVALGAGSILDPEVLTLVRSNGVLVYLRTDPQDAWERIRGTSRVGLLYKPGEPAVECSEQDAHLRLETLLQIRETAYLGAHIVVDTGGRTPGEVVERILWELQKRRVQQGAGGSSASCP